MSSYQPHPIEQKSYEIIDGLVDFSCYPEAHREIYKRVIHTTGDTGFIKGFNSSGNFQWSFDMDGCDNGADRFEESSVENAESENLLHDPWSRNI